MTQSRPADTSGSALLRWLPFAVIAAIWARELFIDVIDVDSAQYAHIALEMLQTKSFLVVHNRGLNYLDKPPLTFWLAAASFATFGVSTWAYKLPSLLFAIIGVSSTYRLARLYYSWRTAWTAELLLASSLAMFIWTNDVRTDMVLTGAVTFALWQLARWQQQGGWLSFVLGFVGVGLALLAKGPVGLIVPVAAIGGDALLRRDLRGIFSPVWLTGLAISLVLLSPMLLGLHEQYGWDGWRFYFWTQSFGRITGSSSWHDSTTPLFFTHTILWELLPWTPLFLLGFGREVARLVANRFRVEGEGFVLSGFFLPFVALSLSHYKLPHYLLVILPLACIIAAKEVERLTASDSWFRVAAGLQWLVNVALAFIGGWLLTEAFPSRRALMLVGAGVVLALVLGMPRFGRWMRLIGPSLSMILAVAAALATHVYPSLLRYEASVSAAQLASTFHVPADRIFAYRTHPYSLDFQLRRSVPELLKPADFDVLRTGDESWVFTDAQGLSELRDAGLPIGNSATLDDFHISQLTLPFLRRSTRNAHVGRRYLVHVRPG